MHPEQVQALDQAGFIGVALTVSHRISATTGVTAEPPTHNSQRRDRSALLAHAHMKELPSESEGT